MKNLILACLMFGVLGGCDVSEPQSPAVVPGMSLSSATNRQVPANWREIVVNDPPAPKLSYLIPRDWLAGTRGFVSHDRTASVVMIHSPSDYSFETDMQVNLSALKEDPSIKILMAKPVFPSGFRGMLIWYQDDDVFVQQLMVKNGLQVYTLACGTYIKTNYLNQKVCQDIVGSLMFF